MKHINLKTAKARRAHRSRWLWLWNRAAAMAPKAASNKESRLEEPMAPSEVLSAVVIKLRETTRRQRQICTPGG